MSALATADGLRSFPVGCLSSKMSRTVLRSPQVLLTGTRSSKLSLSPLPCLVRRRMAGLTFPWNISLAKVCASWVSDVLCGPTAKWSWIERPSWRRVSKSPSSHSLIRRSKQRMWSLAFDVLCGFCSKRAGIIMAHFRAIVSRVDPSA